MTTLLDARLGHDVNIDTDDDADGTPVEPRATTKTKAWFDSARVERR
jgi:hypothetical protein